MKKLVLQSTNFEIMLEAFTNWMKTLNYAKKSIKSLPNHVKEFLHFLEQKDVREINQIKHKHSTQFLVHIQSRPNETYYGALSTYSINKIIVSLNLFFKYLRAIGVQNGQFNLRRIPDTKKEIEVLTLKEIERLFQATYVNKGKNHIAIGTRDRAMLAIFYACGLRRSEGLNLNIEDIDLNKREINVLGKGDKERVVPISRKAVGYIEAYMYSGREWFLIRQATGKQKINCEKDAFFLGEKGKRFSEGVYPRLKKLRERADLEKKVNLHILRHSIATHLLVAGMELEDIAKFLGHASLESTQIYTHIAYNYENMEQLVD